MEFGAKIGVSHFEIFLSKQFSFKGAIFIYLVKEKVGGEEDRSSGIEKQMDNVQGFVYLLD